MAYIERGGHFSVPCLRPRLSWPTSVSRHLIPLLHSIFQENMFQRCSELQSGYWCSECRHFDPLPHVAKWGWCPNILLFPSYIQKCPSTSPPPLVLLMIVAFVRLRYQGGCQSSIWHYRNGKRVKLKSRDSIFSTIARSPTWRGKHLFSTYKAPRIVLRGFVCKNECNLQSNTLRKRNSSGKQSHCSFYVRRQIEES